MFILFLPVFWILGYFIASLLGYRQELMQKRAQSSSSLDSTEFNDSKVKSQEDLEKDANKGEQVKYQEKPPRAA
jgi:hypothetical protein